MDIYHGDRKVAILVGIKLQQYHRDTGIDQNLGSNFENTPKE